MFSIQQTVKEHIAYNEGYSKGQEDAHRYYHMMFTGKQELQNSGGEPMNGNIEREILGEWVDKGYSLKEYDDHVVTVVYKDKELNDQELEAFGQTAPTTTPEALRAVCQRHEARLREAVEVTQ